jgi:Bax protein
MNDNAQPLSLIRPAPLRSVVADALPLALLIALGLWYWLSSPPPTVAPVELKSVSASDAAALQRVFEAHDYQWLPQGPVPPLSVRTFPRDLAETPSGMKKSLFFRSLLPLVLAQNRQIRIERARLTTLFSDGDLAPDSPPWHDVAAIAREYQVKGDLNAPDVRRELLSRVDEIPPSLALAQAANESAWGTSRFAREGNNLFGQWTWDKSQGMLPKQRPTGATHYVRRFQSLRASVRAYMRNLNTHGAYAELRDHRQRLRQGGVPVTGMRLAGGLTAYSERGMAYVNEIREMISFNRLQRINDARLASAE